MKEVVAAAADLEPLEVKLFDVPPRVALDVPPLVVTFRPPFVGLTLAGLMKADPLHSINVKRTANRALLEEGFIIICSLSLVEWG